MCTVSSIRIKYRQVWQITPAIIIFHNNYYLSLFIFMQSIASKFCSMSICHCICYAKQASVIFDVNMNGTFYTCAICHSHSVVIIPIFIPISSPKLFLLPSSGIPITFSWELSFPRTPLFMTGVGSIFLFSVSIIVVVIVHGPARFRLQCNTSEAVKRR